MKKETIEVYRHRKHVKGYAMFLNADHIDYKILESNGRPNHSTIMQVLIDFCKGKNIVVYSHELQSESIDKPEYGFYESENFKGKIPYCDLVYYLDIYYQEK